MDDMSVDGPPIATVLPRSGGSDRGTPSCTIFGVYALGALIAVELLLNTVLKLPDVLRFRWFAFEDLGGSLIVQRLLDKGLRPAVDFYYPYGLLPLLVGRGWFGLFGQTPQAYVAATLLCNIIIAWTLARFTAAVRATPAALFLLLVAMPLTIQAVYLNLTHALEAVLLCNALAEHARGRKAMALTLTTICALIKPTMAYVYGFLLMVLILRDMVRRRETTLAGWWNAFGPAAVTGAALCVLLVATFGLRPFLAIQLPASGSASYAIMGYGFFHGQGRNFWLPPGARLNYYLGTAIGFWTLATLILIGMGLAAVWRCSVQGHRRLAHPGPRDSMVPRDEVIACCVLMHVAFVCLFYGMSWDWKFYMYVLVLGIVATIRPGPGWIATVGLLAPLALVGQWSSVSGDIRNWTSTAPSLQTAGLWADAQEREEWTCIRELCRGRRPLILKVGGCAEMLFPQFEGTDSWFIHKRMVERLAPPPELERIVERVKAARTIVVVRESKLTEVPIIREAMTGFTLAWHGARFDLYLRADPGDLAGATETSGR